MKRQLESYLLPYEVANRLRISERTLAKQRVEGRGPPFVKIGGRVRYPESSLIRYLDGDQP